MFVAFVILLSTFSTFGVSSSPLCPNATLNGTDVDGDFFEDVLLPHALEHHDAIGGKDVRPRETFNDILNILC